MDLRMRDDYIKNEKIDGVIYDMSPAADFRHGLINSSIHSAIREFPLIRMSLEEISEEWE